MSRFLKVIGFIFIVIGFAITTSVFYVRYYYSIIGSNLTNDFDNRKQEQNIAELDIEEAFEEGYEEEIIENGNITQDMEITEADITGGIGIFEMPDYNIRVGITEGTSMSQLRYSLGHFTETPFVGENDNCAICGHSSTIYDCVLDEIHNAKLGDKMIVHTKDKKYTYYITSIEVVAPNATYVLSSTGKEQLTVITCIEGGTKRLVVTGEPMGQAEYEKYLVQLEESKEDDTIFNYGVSSRIINSMYPSLREKGFLIPLSYDSYTMVYCREPNFEEEEEYGKIVDLSKFNARTIQDFFNSLNSAKARPVMPKPDNTLAKKMMLILGDDRDEVKQFKTALRRSSKDNERLVKMFNRIDFELEEEE